MRRVTVKADVQKLCPYKNERDSGVLTLTFLVAGDAPELHALAERLAVGDHSISHEDYTAAALAEWADAGCVHARSVWVTAGMEVTVDVPGDQH